MVEHLVYIQVIEVRFLFKVPCHGGTVYTRGLKPLGSQEPSEFKSRGQDQNGVSAKLESRSRL